ncbi:MAG: ATP-binding domain-containing protein, partial [Pseudomonadales bacterium]|nr:ATP-binding domain-containing protein [Pseudomonadales bacterium]
AKGLEFDHVVILDGGWGRDDAGNRAQRSDEALRLYYVAMTRARQTLTLLRMSAANELELRDAPAQHRGGDYWLRDTTALVHREYIDRSEPPPELDARYEPLELKDVDLGFAGQRG